MSGVKGANTGGWLLKPVGEWARKAECATANPEIFSTGGDDRIPVSDLLRAAQICGRCPVRTECGDEAEAHGDIGIWGGVLRNATGPRVDLVARIGDAEWWADRMGRQSKRHLKVVGE